MKIFAVCSTALVSVSLLFCAPSGAAEPDGPVTFSASVRVDVDAGGNLTVVEVPQDLPEAIRKVIESRVRSWQYLPARNNGVPQPATSYVGVRACAVPVEGGYRMGVDFAYNGPRGAGDKPFPAPTYPAAAQMAGTSAEFGVVLEVGGDGQISNVQVEQVSASSRRGLSGFEPELRRWAKRLHFDLEIVNGQPVSAQVRIPVSFVSGSSSRNYRATMDDYHQRAMQTRECQMASGQEDGLRPVALQEPVIKVIPTPAG